MTNGLDIMSRCHAITPQFIRQLMEQAKFKIAIATHTWVRCAPLSVLIEEILDNGCTKLLANVHDMVLNAQFLCQATRAFDEVGFRSAFSKLAGQIIDAHSHAYHFVTLFLKQQTYGGTIHSA